MSEQIKVGGRYRFKAAADRDLDSIVVDICEGFLVYVSGDDWDGGRKYRTDIWRGSPFLRFHTFREMAFESVDTAKCQVPEHPDSAQLLEARGHEFAVLAGQDRELIKVLLRRLLRELEGGA